MFHVNILGVRTPLVVLMESFGVLEETVTGKDPVLTMWTSPALETLNPPARCGASLALKLIIPKFYYLVSS